MFSLVLSVCQSWQILNRCRLSVFSLVLSVCQSWQILNRLRLSVVSLVLSFRQSWQILNRPRLSVFSCALFCASLIAMFFAPVNSAYASDDECSKNCIEYFQATANQCNVDINCNDMCGAEIDSSDKSALYRHFENQWSEERSTCATEKKESFMQEFIAECESHFTNINNGVPVESQIVCEGGSKGKPNCGKYCASQAETAYGTSIDGETIADGYVSMAKEDRRGGSSLRADFVIGGESRVSYFTMIEEVDTVVDSAINKWKNDTFENNEYPTPGSGTTTEGLATIEICKLGMIRCEAELKNALEEAQETCAELQTSAQECCHEPEECVGGGLAHALDGLGKLNVALSQFKSRKRQCDAVQQTFGAYGAMQGAMAAQCTNTADECVQGCNSALDKVVSAFEKACNYNPRTGGEHDPHEHTCDDRFLYDYVREYKSDNNDQQISIAGVPEACKRTGREANRRIHDMSTNLGASLMASVKECDESGPIVPIQPPAPLTPLPPLPPPNPAGVPDPKPYDGGGGTKKLNVERNQLPSDTPLQQAANPFDQEPDIPPLEPKPKGVAGKMGGLIASGGGGGGGGGGLSGGGGGGGGGPGRGPAGGGGKKKKVLLGFKGGKFAGYGSGGGFDGEKEDKKRAAAKRGKNKKGVAKLNLKKLLPKGKQLNHAVSKFGSPHDNIFQRLSNRYQWMCKTKRIDCE